MSCMIRSIWQTSGNLRHITLTLHEYQNLRMLMAALLVLDANSTLPVAL